VTSLQQQVSEMAKTKLELGNNVSMSVVINRNPGQVDNLVNPRHIGVNNVNQRNIVMNSTGSTTTSTPEEVLPGLNVVTEHVQFQQFVNDTNNNIGCINNLSAIASYNGNQPLENNVNLVGNESSSRYYMHQAEPLGATISKILKRKIWANEFIELVKLLPESVEKTLKPKTLQVESLSNPVLALREQDNTITSLDLWLTAFSIYMSIYKGKHPGSVSGILQYMKVVREIAKRKGN
jgi:hypothetical protein